ncbi:hypothetical protein BCR33DRAFT_773134 [Rhizoclosmatium globosum]|uniref:Uncharacterized protein n=1 Tax=Rhizoclosmatium globosum TaxID=329046 RepID=A0A1Y2B0E1_9FUNG|nr:hypothetical protein BCR33DRAFT_773134 [Rhizoclosmatium globosum]|eukprot:ORY27555.1 hypothetical protein BCR33DRAFT_773134 [Rhizoclosmatium globosum]
MPNTSDEHDSDDDMPALVEVHSQPVAEPITMVLIQLLLENPDVVLDMVQRYPEQIARMSYRMSMGDNGRENNIHQDTGVLTLDPITTMANAADVLTRPYNGQVEARNQAGIYNLRRIAYGYTQSGASVKEAFEKATAEAKDTGLAPIER